MAGTSLLHPGSSIVVPDETRLLSLDVRWNTGTQTAFAERLAVAALPLSRGRLPGREHLVFDNQPHSPDGSVRLGRQDGVVEIDLAAVAPEIEQISVVVHVRPRPNAPRRTLDEVDGLSLSVEDALAHAVLGRSASLHGLLGAVTGSTVADVVREGSGWNVIIQARGHESGLDGAAATAGLRL